MADSYDALLLRLIGQLETNTQISRQQLYSQAREILLNRLKTQRPPVSVEGIRSEQSKLDEAIQRVESQYDEQPLFKGNPTFGSLSSGMKAAIAIPSTLLIVVLFGLGYFYFRSKENITTPATQVHERTTITRSDALRLLSTTSPVQKPLPLTIAVPGFLKVSNQGWSPPVEFTRTMIEATNQEFERQMETFRDQAWNRDVMALYGALKVLRSYRETGVFENFVPEPAWTGILKAEWKTFCSAINNDNSDRIFQGAGLVRQRRNECSALTARRSVSAVTGIAGDANAAMVEYVVEQKLTDFGRKLYPAFQILDPSDPLSELKETRELFVAQLFRYDDGWRVVKVQQKQ